MSWTSVRIWALVLCLRHAVEVCSRGDGRRQPQRPHSATTAPEAHPPAPTAPHPPTPQPPGLALPRAARVSEAGERLHPGGPLAQHVVLRRCGRRPGRRRSRRWCPGRRGRRPCARTSRPGRPGTAAPTTARTGRCPTTRPRARCPARWAARATVAGVVPDGPRLEQGRRGVEAVAEPAGVAGAGRGREERIVGGGRAAAGAGEDKAATAATTAPPSRPSGWAWVTTACRAATSRAGAPVPGVPRTDGRGAHRRAVAPRAAAEQGRGLLAPVPTQPHRPEQASRDPCPYPRPTSRWSARWCASASGGRSPSWRAQHRDDAGATAGCRRSRAGRRAAPRAGPAARRGRAPPRAGRRTVRRARRPRRSRAAPRAPAGPASPGPGRRSGTPGPRRSRQRFPVPAVAPGVHLGAARCPRRRASPVRPGGRTPVGSRSDPGPGERRLRQAGQQQRQRLLGGRAHVDVVAARGACRAAGARPGRRRRG